MATDRDIPEVLAVAFDLVETLERLGISYVIGGSLASSLHGIPRATADVDLVADVRPEHVSLLVAHLEDRYYVVEDAVAEAVARGASFNILHLETMFKLDVFVPAGDPWVLGELARARELEVAGGRLRVATPEDIVAHKLHWYELGGRVSDRQWNDALGVVQVTGELLDRELLRYCCRELGVPGRLVAELLGEDRGEAPD